MVIVRGNIMGLLRNMKGKFGRRKVQTQEVEYVPSEEDTSLKRDDVDVHDKQQRERYVKACLEQMAVASKELETLGGEYNLVTSYLTDIEEIEALPPELKTQIADMAKTLVEIESSHKQKQERKLIMSEEQYLHMERISEYMPAGYDKLKKTEEYQVLVKRDLNRLEGEKQAYLFRKNELQNGQKNMKGMTTICVGSMVFLMILLAILGITFGLDVTMGYLIAVLIAATALTLVYVKYGDSERELVRVNKAMNKIVLLQNTVKIRYVNNTNLLDYLYTKYDVDNSTDLKKLWGKYIEEKKQREEECQLQKDLDFNQSELIKLLRKCKVQDPNVWLHQAEALYNSKEMVEIRHGLIIRRQKLRKQMEYNAKAAQDAQDEVKDLVQKFPEYAKKILDMVSEYEKAM